MVELDASTHKSAKTHAGHIFDLWPSPFDPKINGFPGLILERFYIKFGGPTWISFWDIVRKRQRKGDKNHTPTTAVGVGS